MTNYGELDDIEISERERNLIEAAEAVLESAGAAYMSKTEKEVPLDCLLALEKALNSYNQPSRDSE